MAVQNPFFGGRREGDTGASKFLGSTPASAPGSTLPNTAAGSASSVLGGAMNTGRSVEADEAPVAAASTGSKLTVGPNIKLKGVEITDCDTLVVEGIVEATITSRVIQIAAQGAFRGSAEIDIAEIHGEFDGNLTVRDKLVIFGSGRVHGKIRYGKVVIEEGGQITGEITCAASSRPASSQVVSTTADKPDSASAT